MQIREMNNNDWNDVARIYQEGMDSNLATFETQCPSFDKFDTSHLKECRYVAIENDNVIGWCVLSPISSRCVYQGVVEVSIYVDSKHASKGIGTALLNHMIEETENRGYWTIQSGIMENNIASIRLHEKCGFRMIGYRERIGKDVHGKWRNTVLMERRSNNND